jgi:hypothetical protein
VNAALNLYAGAELAQQERKAASFVFTPAFCGFDPPLTRASAREMESQNDTKEKGRQRQEDAKKTIEPYGYRPTRGYAYPVGPKLGTAVAISGAAANPNWGYHTSGPMAFLLTVFNARLGWWLGNPRRRESSRYPGPVLALRYLLAELLGQTTGRSQFVNLSDGGHFENLGLYELVRRRCRFIIVGDAEQDAGLTFSSLGGAIRKCRADFGVEIDINPDSIRLGANTFSKTHCVVGSITYPEDESAFTAGLTSRIGPPPDPKREARVKARGWLLYIKSSLTGDEPMDVLEYRSAFPEFPHQTTGDQFFSESQFESYRRLGYHALRSAFEGITLQLDGAIEDTDLEKDLYGRYPLVKLFQELTCQWYAPIPVSDEATTRLANAYVDIMKRLAEQADLQHLRTELVDGVASGEGDKEDPLDPKILAFGMELIQLMQNVYTEFKFEGAFNQANPRNGGWMGVFRQWLGSDYLYKRIWRKIRGHYHSLFGEFIDRVRDEVAGKPPKPMDERGVRPIPSDPVRP